MNVADVVLTGSFLVVGGTSSPGGHISTVATYPDGRNRPPSFDAHGCCVCRRGPKPDPTLASQCARCNRLIPTVSYRLQSNPRETHEPR